jgi:hypothetical protein
MGEGQERREARYSERVDLGGGRWCVCVSALLCFLVNLFTSSSIKIRHVFCVLSIKETVEQFPEERDNRKKQNTT